MPFIDPAPPKSLHDWARELLTQPDGLVMIYDNNRDELRPPYFEVGFNISIGLRYFPGPVYVLR